MGSNVGSIDGKLVGSSLGMLGAELGASEKLTEGARDGVLLNTLAFAVPI